MNIQIANQIAAMCNRMAKEWLDKSISRVIEVSELEVGEYSEHYSTVYAGEYTLEVSHKTKIEEDKQFEWQYSGGQDHDVCVGCDYIADVTAKNIDARDENGKLVATACVFDRVILSKIEAVIEIAASAKAEKDAEEYDPL
jgi:hypothetical protein